MREALFWRDPPSYFRHAKGFLSFNLSIPADMLANAGPRTNGFDINNTAGHFALMNHQLRQLRHAFALASLSGRALVIPQLWCGLDRWWAPHTGASLPPFLPPSPRRRCAPAAAAAGAPRPRCGWRAQSLAG